MTSQISLGGCITLTRSADPIDDETTEIELRTACESLNHHELQKIIQAVYAMAGGLQ